MPATLDVERERSLYPQISELNLLDADFLEERLRFNRNAANRARRQNLRNIEPYVSHVIYYLLTLGHTVFYSGFYNYKILHAIWLFLSRIFLKTNNKIFNKPEKINQLIIFVNYRKNIFHWHSIFK